MKPLVNVHAFNEAMSLLLKIAKDEDLDSVSVFVRQDGRTAIYGASHLMTRWCVDGDLHPGGALPTPGDALAARQAPSNATKGDQ